MDRKNGKEMKKTVAMRSFFLSNMKVKPLRMEKLRLEPQLNA
jgi:hypothetical protein